MNFVPQSKGALAAVVAALALTALALLLSLNGNSSQAADSQGVAPRPPLAVLGDPPPAAPVPFLDQSPAPPGLDLAGARVAQTNDAGSALIAVEKHDPDGAEMICAIATDPGHPQAGAGSCATRDAFAANGVFAVLMGDTSREVIGLLPDGVTQVTATGADGSSTVVPVRNNAIRLPYEAAQRVSFTIGGAEREQDLALASAAR